MDERYRSAFRGQVPVFLSQLVLCALMVAVYACIGRLNTLVLLGALCGLLASLLNYSAMIFAVLKAENSDSPEKAQLKVRGSYLLRTVILFAALVVVIRFGGLDPLATLLPLALMRIALFIGSFFVKGGHAK